MTEQTEPQADQAEETPPADATIEMRMKRGGLDINVFSDGRVTMKYGGKEFEAAVKQVNRKQARSGARVLPGRAGS